MSGTYSTEADFLRGALDWWNGPIKSTNYAIIYVRPTADRSDVIRHADPFEDSGAMFTAYAEAIKNPGVWNYIAMLSRPMENPLLDSHWSPPTPLLPKIITVSTPAKAALGILASFGLLALMSKGK